jgi:outer membrane usher protein FimD/PapC
VVNPIGVNLTLVVDRPGTYMVQITVNDDQMDSLPDRVTIHTVNPIATLLEHALLAQGFVKVQEAAFPHCLPLQNRDSTCANLVEVLRRFPEKLLLC